MPQSQHPNKNVISSCLNCLKLRVISEKSDKDISDLNGLGFNETARLMKV